MKNKKLFMGICLSIIGFLGAYSVIADTGAVLTGEALTGVSSTGNISSNDSSLGEIVIDPITKKIYITTGFFQNTGSTTTNTEVTTTSNTTSNTTTSTTTATNTGSEFEQALAWMYANGLTKYADMSGYRPNDFLTRQEVAKMVAQAYTIFGYEQADKNNSCSFLDANIFDPSLSEHINKVCRRGIFKGFQGNFMPEQTLTRPQAMAVLIRMFEGKSSYEAKNPRWGDYYLKGKAIGLTNFPQQNNFEEGITRYEMALYIFRLKKIIENQNLKVLSLNTISQIGGTGYTSSNSSGTGNAVIDLSKLTTDLEALAANINVNKDPELQEAIKWMNDNGLTKFSTISEYRPFETLLREQAGKMLNNFGQIFGLSKDFAGVSAECTFKDIGTADQTLVTHIQNVCQMGLLKGKNGIFNPKAVITKSEFVVALIRLFEGKQLDETGNPRWKSYFERAQDLGIVGPADSITFDSPITRYEVALFLYRFKVKYQMLQNLNNSKIQNEIISTVPGSMSSGDLNNTGNTNKLEANVYVNMNLIQDGNFQVGYIEIFGSRYKIVKTITKTYFSNNFVWYGELFNLEDDVRVGTVSFEVSNLTLNLGTVRLENNHKNFIIQQIPNTSAYYKISEL